jgi:putative tryptophan/tyrosine transport system substrate-binding protein
LGRRSYPKKTPPARISDELADPGNRRLKAPENANYRAVTSAFKDAFAAIAEQHPDILLVLQDALTLEYRKEIIGFALREQIPSMYVGKEWVEEGGLMSYGDRLPERYRRAADLVDRILRGAKPADLPVEQPTTFELVVNLKTAKAIGLNLSPTFLARADQVIE